MKSPGARDDWNLIVRFWRNDLRYLSRDGVLGYVRQFHDLVQGIRGGPDAILRTVASRILEAAAVVHMKGVVAWTNYTRK